VFDIRQKVLGPEHPDTLMSMSNLASVLNNQGDYDETEGYADEAMRIHRRVRPSYHCGARSTTHQCLRIDSNGSQT
jgi:hypothetical protein